MFWIGRPKSKPTHLCSFCDTIGNYFIFIYELLHNKYHCHHVVRVDDFLESEEMC